jgi:phospholipid transport system substrate-binding protein
MSRLRLPVFLLALALFAFPARAETAPAIKLVQNFYAALEATMKEGPKLGFEGRVKKLDPAVRKTFNLPVMARRAVGFSWSQQTPKEQQALVEAFSRFSVATYASRFKKYDGEKFEILGERPAQGGVIVETRLMPKGDAPVALHYLIVKDETGAPRIMDVYLDGAISELATRRADFGAVIKREGFRALIDSLSQKTQTMGP